MQTSILFDILNTPAYPPIMLERQMAVSHFDFKSGMRFCAMSPYQNNSGGCDVLQKNSGTEYFSSVIPKKLETIAGLIAQSFPRAIYTFWEDKVILLLDRASLLDESILMPLKKLWEQAFPAIGISNSFLDLAQLHRYFEQALTAHSYALKFADMSFKYYIVYEDIAQLEMLRVLTAHSTALDFCSPDILKLINIDKKKQTQLAQTLSVYLNCFGDGILAAKKLGIHKNTLYYRLSVIKNILDNDLTDGETNYTYMFTFRTLHYLGIFQLIDL